MPQEFALPARLAGFAGAAAAEGDRVQVVVSQLVAPLDGNLLLDRLERLQQAVFEHIPDLPSPSRIDHILVVIRQDLTATAYVNELNIVAEIVPNRNVEAGEPVRVRDIERIAALDLGVEIGPDEAVIVVRTSGWRRSVFFDLGPILDDPRLREYELEEILAHQALLLLGLAGGRPADRAHRVDQMRAGLARLEQLLDDQCEEEQEYQELLRDHPWMLGGLYDSVLRHAPLDDARIPDFTARRSHDQMHDVIEIKQPFLPLFRQNGAFRAEFNNAWNQCIGYLGFCNRNRPYLREEKRVDIDNPRCLLLIGNDPSEVERRLIREQEAATPNITVWTYQELLRVARQLFSIMEAAGEQDFD